MTPDEAMLAMLIFSFAVGTAVGILLVVIAQLLPFRRLHLNDYALHIKPVLTVDDVQASIKITPRVSIPNPDPIVIPIQTAPAPPVAELAQRILAEADPHATRALARILDVSPSTAHTIVTSYNQSQGESHDFPGQID